MHICFVAKYFKHFPNSYIFLIFLKLQITNIFKKKKLAVLKFYNNNKLENKIQA